MEQERKDYIYLYISDRENHATDVFPEINTIEIEKEKTMNELLLKIYEKMSDNIEFFTQAFGIFKEINRHKHEQLMDLMFSEYLKLALPLKSIELQKLFLDLYGYDLWDWLFNGDNDKIIEKKKINIMQKICKENLTDLEIIKIMKLLEKRGHIIIQEAVEWEKKRKEYENEIKQLKKKIEKLEDELKYIPGNTGYFEALTDFNHRKN